MLNQVNLMGYVGQAPEQRENGPVRLTLATNRKYKDRDGNTVDNTQWHTIVVWGKLGDVVTKYVTKGMLVHITGRIEYQKYEKDGEKCTATQIVAEGLKMVPTGKRSETQSDTTPEFTTPSSITSEDIPF